ncbi:hypothetical protein [Aliihoeflea sp. PC F10.4]
MSSAEIALFLITIAAIVAVTKVSLECLRQRTEIARLRAENADLRRRGAL